VVSEKGKSTIEYTLETHPFNWLVPRKLEDVVWLYDQIQRLFPLTIVI